MLSPHLYLTTLLSRYFGVAVLLLTMTLQGQAQQVRPHGATPPQEDAMLIVPATGEQVPVPTTDAEALRLLDYGQTPLTTTMRGLYQAYRAQGYAVLAAFAKALQALMDAKPQ